MTAFHRFPGVGDLSGDSRHPNSPDYDDTADIAAEEIIDGWMADPVKVAAALDEIAGTSDLNSDGNSHFAADLAELLSAGPDYRGEHIYRLERKVRDYFRDDAEAELQKWRDEGEEARDAARRAA